MNKEFYPKEYTEHEINWLKNNFNESEKKRYKNRKSISYKYLNNIDIKEDLEKRDINFNINKVFLLGGNELVVLYITGINYELAAKELKISVNSLRSKIYRLREKLLEENINISDLRSFLY